ncbi:MAG TPA: hypothetical protein VN814_16175 [Caulobacteraceae bacterium]|nr:hypothetical protein [Caulobacteraceae bacterium]
MLKTYTLYLRDGSDDVRFEPAMCSSDAEALARARMLLSEHPECEAVDVFFGGDQLFRFGREPLS